jgi:predicted transcriptional regulator
LGSEKNTMNDDRSEDVVTLAADLTAAWLSNPNVRPMGEDAVSFLKSIHSTLQTLSGQQAESGTTDGEGEAPGSSDHYEPAVTVRKSLASRDKIISLIDGKPYSSLKRHLTSHGLTPAEYRARYGLKADYPMVAPAYAETRRELAKKIGLGRGGRGKAASAKPAAAKASSTKKAGGKSGVARRGRPPKAVAPAS